MSGAEAIRRSYDAAAADYALHLADELNGKALDREWLDRFARRLRGKGTVCDLGCGPGHIAGYLQAAGVDVCGIDLSSAMVAEAARRSPRISFREGDMLALDITDGSMAGLVAFYAIVHFTPQEVREAFREMKRVLRQGGLLLLAFHVGVEVVHRDDMWGNAVDLDFRFFRSTEIRDALEGAGFEIEEEMEREPYAEIEYPSRRAYILAKRIG